MKNRRIFFPILFKLIILITLLVSTVGLITTYKNSELFENISKEREENANLNQANAKSLEVEGLIQSYVGKVKFFGLYLLSASMGSEEGSELMHTTFQSDQDLLAIEIKKKDQGSITSLQTLVNEKLLEKNKMTTEFIEKLRKEIKFPEEKTFNGDILVINATITKGIPLVQVGIPILKDEAGSFTHIAHAYVLLDRLQKTFSTAGERTLYLVDYRGKVVAHENEKLALLNQDFSNIPIIADAINATVRLKQKYFDNPVDHQRYVGAYARTPYGLIVVAQSPEQYILAPSAIVRQQGRYLLGIILSLTFFFVYIFSNSITTPIKKLLLFTREISKGNFDINASKEVKAHDEVGILAEAFDEMAIGLKERDKIKTMFNKFHGTSVTTELLESSLNREGKSRDVTVFFSDIRGFTDFSEHHSPEEVVAMLNSYFEIMVTIINKNSGVVDKFIGDAIMAIWGAPHSTPHDTFNCLKACLEMRVALLEFNNQRMAQEKPPIKIGMGVHSGIVISGTVGSEERMEYTVIGDTVNTASRIEAATKAFGTDILLSGETKDRIKDQFILELAGETEVKGKSDTLKLYKVKGYYDNGQEVIIETPYSSYKAEKADKVKVK